MSSNSSVGARKSPGGLHRVLHRALVATTVVALCAYPQTIEAQNSPSLRRSWEFLASSGALVPIGVQRAAIKDAAMSTAQLSYVFESRLAVTTMVGWARSRDLGSADDPRLDVFTYDLGVEARGPRWMGGAVTSFTPFVGAGAGTRSYNYRTLDVAATHNPAAYAALGGDLGVGRVHIRLEVRDYLTKFKPLAGSGSTGARNDVVAIAGLRFTRSGA